MLDTIPITTEIARLISTGHGAGAARCSVVSVSEPEPGRTQRGVAGSDRGGGAAGGPETLMAMTSEKEGILQMQPSGRWAVVRPGRAPVDVFRVEVPGEAGLRWRLPVAGRLADRDSP
jgi:hypothetical protein